MYLKFADQAIKEYSQGNFHVANDGKPFDVIGDLAAELLKAKHSLDANSVNVVDVFRPATPDEVEAAKAVGDESDSADSLASGYPDEFPGAEALAEAGLKFEEAILLTREQLVEIKGIGPKTADGIVDAIKAHSSPVSEED